MVIVLSAFGPAGLIPDLAPAALTPAADLAQSRSEIQDPYVALMVLGCLIAVLQSAATVTDRAMPSRLAPPAR
jgi:hypothetical protein